MRRYPTEDVFWYWKLDAEYIKQRDAKRLARRKATTQRQTMKLMTRGKIRLR